jgi:hypothetical protein
MPVRPVSNPHVGLLPWGHTIEDFLDTLGVSLESFCSEMTGGWLFGYATALKIAGVKTSIFCVSSRSSRVSRSIHKPTGCEVFLIPASALYRRLRNAFADPYAWETAAMFAGTKTHHKLRRLLRDILPYTATPLHTLLRELKRGRVNALLCQEYEYARFDVTILLEASWGTYLCDFSRGAPGIQAESNRGSGRARSYAALGQSSARAKKCNA